MADRLVKDCFRRNPENQARLSHNDAVAQLRTSISPVTDKIALNLDQTNGRICAASVTAPRSVPGHSNAAVDGYAFAHESLTLEGANKLRIVTYEAAGHPSGHVIKVGEAARIFTGAVLPAGCDTVAMQEDCEMEPATSSLPDAVVRIPAGVSHGANVRSAGEDVGNGDVIIEAGHVIRPQDVAALASVGCTQITCYAPPRIAVLSSGDEVVRAGEAALSPGQIYDANGPMLLSLAAATGAHVTDLGVLPDRPEDAMAALRDAAYHFDLILTSGGAGRGDEDHMASAIRELGTCYFWNISVKPGKPLMFGQIGSTVVAGLPGNPVAAFVCFLIYVYPVIRRLGGARWPEPRRFPLPASFAVKTRKTGRREFWRGSTRLQDGKLMVEKFARDGSGLISGLRAADGLIDIAEYVTSVQPGDIVNFIPFSEFGIGIL